MKNKQKIYILDTTLRDGQQAPGAGMSFEDNLTYSQYADELGIDILEAGFPSASNDDFEIVNTIAKNLAAQRSTMKIAAVCQLREEQIVRTMNALSPSLTLKKARIHTYVPVDPNLMQASLGKFAKNFTNIVADVYRLVKQATDAGFEVEFTPEGYSCINDNFEFTTQIIIAAIEAGATIINCPDTIGGAARWQVGDYFVSNMQKHANIIAATFPQQQIMWSTHCHNDLGLALDNTMTAVFVGPARQIEGCINGVGERAGNVSLEQCIMIINQFGHLVHPEVEFYTDINLEKLTTISNFIAQKMLVRQPHWPITGENAARHSSGGHTNAILKNPMAYQPYNPKIVGKHLSFVFGQMSGSNHVKDILEKNGFSCPQEEKSSIAQAIKNRYADRRKGITDEELIAGFFEYRAPIKANKIEYSKDENQRVRLHIEGQFFSEGNIVVYCDDGNSSLAALDQAVKQYFPTIEISDYRSNACAGNGVKAKCNSTITVTINNDESYLGKAIDSDINISAIKAYINAVNQAYVYCFYRLDEDVYAA